MSDKKHELRSCVPLVTQLATSKGKNATNNATTNATVDLKALALEGLKRNKQRNQSATKEKKERNSSAIKPTQKLRKENCDKCSCLEELPKQGSGCVSKLNGNYQYQWSLLATLEQCPRGYWN